ncbi:MAG: hypothetical protein K0R75_3634, partial [Paenibacillaceae bacterium]|nr:hypothetical protein [Paenibacillaceae bacterium]
MQLQSYLADLSTWEPLNGRLKPTPVTKETYLDLLEIAFNAYSEEQIRSRKQISGAYLDLQSYSRLTNVLACLIHGGRMVQHTELWVHMMTECCREMVAFRANPIADFSLKEMMMAIRWMKRQIPEPQREQWYDDLRRIDPSLQFGYVIRSPGDELKMHNINVYNMVGEYLREAEGLTDTSAYFAKHWPVQLSKFDVNGMYRDPHCPLLYDLTTRCQIQLMLGSGYAGEFTSELDGHLRKASLMTLFMQSAAFEFPYGGRSNQYLFNEALIAANCEYEASRYKREGNLRLASAFKRCGHLAIQSIRRWLEETPVRHIKNYYPIESDYGTETYGYYDKYMITMGAFLAIGCLFADETIAEAPCPAEAGGYVLQTSPSFHKVFANAGGYSLEIDTQADLNYDATGLGRIHRSGVPTELGLSVPLTEGQKYKLRDGVQRICSGISPGWMGEDGELRFLSELSERLTCELAIVCANRSSVDFQLVYGGASLQGCQAVKERYQLSE